MAKTKKPSARQREVLEKLADGGQIEHWTYYNGNTNLRHEKEYLSVHGSTFHTLFMRGWVKWAKQNGAFCEVYRITDAGREALKA